MSLIQKQIKELRQYAKDRKGELAKLINDAADTIDLLSVKLHASQMERSSQYYHGGWIPCTERLPEYGVGVLTFNRDDEYEVNHIIDEEDGEWFFDGVIAWMPLPEPYKEAEHETD